MIALRKERRIYHRIAAEVGVSQATVGRILARHGLNRWRDLAPAEPARRYERDKPGEIIQSALREGAYAKAYPNSGLIPMSADNDP